MQKIWKQSLWRKLLRHMTMRSTIMTIITGMKSIIMTTAKTVHVAVMITTMTTSIIMGMKNTIMTTSIIMSMRSMMIITGTVRIVRADAMTMITTIIITTRMRFLPVGASRRLHLIRKRRLRIFLTSLRTKKHMVRFSGQREWFRQVTAHG